MAQRIPGIELANADASVPLVNHLVYARIPAIFKAVRGMWAGLSESGLLSDTLVVLVNRRVAILNHCPF